MGVVRLPQPCQEATPARPTDEEAEPLRPAERDGAGIPPLGLACTWCRRRPHLLGVEEDVRQPLQAQHPHRGAGVPDALGQHHQGVRFGEHLQQGRAVEELGAPQGRQLGLAPWPLQGWALGPGVGRGFGVAVGQHPLGILVNKYWKLASSGFDPSGCSWRNRLGGERALPQASRARPGQHALPPAPGAPAQARGG